MVQPSESDPVRVDEQLRFLNIVCIALVIGVAALAAVAWGIANGPGANGPVGPPLPDAVAFLGGAVGLALLVAAPIVHRKMLQNAGRVSRDDERVVGALETYRLATMLAFILREGAAVVGLMLTLLTNEPAWCYGLGVLALVAMFWGWPRRDEITGILQPSAA